MDTFITQQIPVTAVVPTAGRSQVLKSTLQSMAAQNYQPEVIIIIDASEDNLTEQVCKLKFEGLTAVIHYRRANEKGAAVQRNQAFTEIDKPVIFFFDDDIVFEERCVERLWNCLQSDDSIGGVNAMITNQQYHTPGKLTRFMYRLMSGENRATYAGKCIGPAWNLLPEDRGDLPETNEVEWVNTTCTLYRNTALPSPPFPVQFKDYSLLEDLCLSLTVGKKWKLFNARNAKIFHNSQSGTHKNNVRNLARMELVNRHYLMVNVLKKSALSDYCKLFLFELFGMVTVLTTISGRKNLIPVIIGKLSAIGKILFAKNKHGQ